jgi:hypothetical protein
VVGQHVGTGDVAEVERRGVVGGHRRIVVAAEDVDQVHAGDGEAQRVQAGEDVQHLLGQRRGHHQLPAGQPAAAVPVVEGQERQGGEGRAARIGVPGLADHPLAQRRRDGGVGADEGEAHRRSTRK